MENKEIKQSSVEWLIRELTSHVDMPSNHYNELAEIAKKLHRDEIIEAFWDGRNKSEPRLSQDYYDEVFGIWQYNQD